MYRVVGEKSKRSYSLDPGSLVGQGVEGRVYARGDQCVKVFNHPLDDDRVVTLTALISLARKVPGFAWPTELVKDPATGEFAGFAMPFVAGESLESILDDRLTASIGNDVKLKLALAMSRAVAMAHAHCGPRIILGDVLKAGNLVVGGDCATFVDAGTVSLIGFRTRDGGVAASTAALTTPGYVPKEVLETPLALPSEASDRFALAVVLFELLFGRSPHEVRPCPAAIGLEPDDAVRRGIYPRWVSHPDFEPPSYDPIDIPKGIDQLFRAAFLASAVRPSALDWCEAIERWIDDVTPKRRRGLRRRMPRWLRRLDPVPIAFVAIVALGYVWNWAYFLGREIYNSPPQSTKPRVIPPAPTREVGPPLLKELFR